MNNRKHTALQSTANEPPTLPDEVRAAIAQAFPGETIGPARPTVGGYSNLTVVLPVGARLLVAKIAHTPLKRADVRHEAHILNALAGSGLPVPQLVALLEEQDITVELLYHIDGQNAMRFFTEERDTLPQLYAAVGRTLAAVHRHTLELPNTKLLPRYTETAAALATVNLPSKLEDALHEALRHPIWSRQGTRLVHGDAGLHNILWDGQLRALLDWEWAGCGLPLLDLAWTAWIMRFRNLDSSLWQTFIAAYSADADEPPVATADELRALALSQVASILIRTAPGTWARDEWQRRAEAALKFTFPSLGV